MASIYQKNVEVLTEIKKHIAHRRAEMECRNIMGQYQHLNSSHQQPQTQQLFCLDDPDVRVEMCWGIYHGKEGIRQCFGRRHQPRGSNWTIGMLFFRSCASPCIEVAGDGQTCRIAWLSFAQGSARNTERESPEDPLFYSGWGDNKYGADYKLVDGKWRFLHLTIYSIANYPFVLAPCDVEAYGKPGTMEDFKRDWAEDDNDGMPDAPPSSWWGYEDGCIYSDVQPDVPLPYYNFEQDVGYGY